MICEGSTPSKKTEALKSNPEQVVKMSTLSNTSKKGESLSNLADALKSTMKKDKTNTESLLDKISNVVREYESFKGELLANEANRD